MIARHEMRKHLFAALAVLATVALSALWVVPRPNTGAAMVRQVHRAAAEQEREVQGKSRPAHELAGAVVGVALIR